MFVRSLALGAVALLSLGVGAAGAHTWGGYYIGLNAGGGRSDVNTERLIGGAGYTFTAADITAVQNASAMVLDEQTFAGGAQIGVNWPLGEVVVVGLEFDAAAFGNDTSRSATAVYPSVGPATFTTTNSLEQTFLATGRLRLGLANDWGMIYATGGYAGADMKFTQTFSDTAGPVALQAIENAEFRSGYSIGGGIELMIESGASLRVEYLHLDLGEITSQGSIAVPTRTSDGQAEVTDQLLRAAINFQMN
jgi:outer membrane immunogenic protein